MEGFQKIVLYSAIFILCIVLVFIGITLTQSTSQVWPPIVPQCPDYWAFDGSGNDAVCVNVKDLGTCSATNGEKHLSMNFNTAPFVGTNELCSKYTWANKCGLSWDGITYGVENPCQSS
jgi:hypothetical protein